MIGKVQSADVDKPIALDLMKFKFPCTAIVSILHRLSGVVIFLALPLFLYLLHQSLVSANGFADVKQVVHAPLMVLVLWAVLSALLFHLLAGLRHILMDMGIAETVPSAKMTAYLVFLLEIVGIVLLGIWLW